MPPELSEQLFNEIDVDGKGQISVTDVERYYERRTTNKADADASLLITQL